MEDIPYEEYRAARRRDKKQQRALLSRAFVVHDNRRGLYDEGKNAAKRLKRRGGEAGQ